MNPGRNNLAMALRIIGSTSVKWFKFLSTTPNAQGIDVALYLNSVTINTGSVQPVKRTKYEFMGLDFAKKYISWHVPFADVLDIDRDYSGDIIEVFGRRYQLQGGSDWFLIDGWRSFTGVDVGTVSSFPLLVGIRRWTQEGGSQATTENGRITNQEGGIYA